MRNLSSTLLSAQRGYGVTGAAYDALWKIVLSRQGQTTRGYDITRVMQIQHTEEEDNGIAEVLLDNSDAAISSLYLQDPSIDFEQYQGIIYYGYNTGVARSKWVVSHSYSVGDIVTPTTLTGYQYRCTTAGTSVAEPTWGTALGVIQTETGGTVVWEMDGNVGDEYSPTAPLKVIGQEFISSETQLQCRLQLIGIPNQMAQDKAIAKYTQESSDTKTCKTLITAVAAASTNLSSAYNGYTAFTYTFEPVSASYPLGYDDSIIDAYIPADYFSISINENRDDKIQELLNYTKCKRRTGSDGAIHIFLPTISGTTYDYEYRLYVSGYHTFFSKNLRTRFVNPNKEIVTTPPDYVAPNVFSGSATSATSYALAPKIHTTYRRLASDARAALIAAAIIERYELNAERGSAVVPMNCGQEIFDYIKVTDSSEGTTRTGNVQYIQRNCKVASDRDDGYYNMTIRFGRVNTQSIGMAEAYGAGIPQWMIDIINAHTKDITELAAYQNSLMDFLGIGSIPGALLLTKIEGDLDDIIDGTSYKKLLATQISAGAIYLSDTSTYKVGYDPSGKRRVFTATPTTPYDVGDLWLSDAVIKRCSTARASGAYVAGDWTAQTLDSIADGTTYSKILSTDISAGHIKLTSGTVADGVWYDEYGVYIGATYGIGLYGGQIALRTYPTYADLVAGTNLQCYVGTDGKIYGAAGTIWLDSIGLTVYEVAAPNRHTVLSGYGIAEYYGNDFVGQIVPAANGIYVSCGIASGAITLTASEAGCKVTFGNNVYLDCASTRIVNVTDPSGDQDAATKKYVDDNITGFGLTYSVRTTGAGANQRLINTEYQNTSGKTRFVTVVTVTTVSANTIANVTIARCSSHATVDDNVCKATLVNTTVGDRDTWATVNFIVPDDYYYIVYGNSYTDWVEVDIG